MAELILPLTSEAGTRITSVLRGFRLELASPEWEDRDSTNWVTPAFLLNDLFCLSGQPYIQQVEPTATWFTEIVDEI